MFPPQGAPEGAPVNGLRKNCLGDLNFLFHLVCIEQSPCISHTEALPFPIYLSRVKNPMSLSPVMHALSIFWDSTADWTGKGHRSLSSLTRFLRSMPLKSKDSPQLMKDKNND